jgi:ferredoxin, 2Fe-2S
MARIVIANLSDTVLEVDNLSKSLLQHLHDHGLDWMHACGAKGRCTTCKAVIISGNENFQRLTKAELSYMELGALARNERLTCQTRITGDVVIAVPAESKLPHIQYSDDN